MNLQITGGYAGSSQLFKNMAKIVLTDPCFDNTVQAEASLSFDLTNRVSFTPASVSDNYSVSKDLTGLCGSVKPVSFSCENFAASDAYLEATTGRATINLNWDTELVNTTLRCNF